MGTKTGEGWAHVNPKLTWNIRDQIKSTFFPEIIIPEKKRKIVS